MEQTSNVQGQMTKAETPKKVGGASTIVISFIVSILVALTVVFIWEMFFGQMARISALEDEAAQLRAEVDRLNEKTKGIRVWGE
ncbi:hypothetical protein GF382_02795 [Candidatus Falkowbacteria bacterium]|nr:hypothetical protein [Candidatus Falkowbacteria bacterium]